MILVLSFRSPELPQHPFPAAALGLSLHIFPPLLPFHSQPGLEKGAAKQNIQETQTVPALNRVF